TGQRIAFEHLEQQPCAAAGRVHLLARRHEARTHGAAVEPPALADADAAQRRLREPAALVRKLEVRRDVRRVVGGAETQVVVDPTGTQHLAGIHPPRRIPDRLELVERRHQLWTVHARQQLAARLAVAVLAGERSAEADDQIGRALDESAIRANPRGSLEIEVDARVDAALAEMPVEIALQMVRIEELPETPQVLAELRRRDR